MALSFNRFIDVRPGEGRLALGAFLTYFGIVAGHTILETARDTLFLSKIPPNQLTVVYAGIAMATLVFASWNTRFVGRFGQRNALVFTLVVGAFVTTLLHFQEATRPVLFGLYIWSALLGALLGAQFWMFAAQVFTVTQGKRLFAAIASGGVVGAVLGATSAAALLPYFPVRSLLLVSACVFFATAVLTTALPRGEVRMEVRAEQRRGPADDAPEGLVALLRRVPYLRRLALFTGLGTATVLVVDYLFKSTAAANVPRAELGAFFARTYAVLNVVSLLVQVFVAARVLRRLGVVAALIVLPLLLAGGNLGIVFFGGTLALSLFAKGADGGLRYSIQRVATELLWMPLARGVQTRAKALIDTVFGKVTQAVVAGFLLLLVPLGFSTPRVLAGVALGLSVLWIGSVLVLRSAYVDLFRQALSRGAVEVPTFAQELDVASVEAVLEALSSRSAPRVIAAMEVLHDQRRDRLLPALILYHESDEVLVRALSIIAVPERHDWVPLADRLLDHPSETVRVAALRALVHVGHGQFVARASHDASPIVRAHAALLGASTDGELVGALREMLRAHGDREDEAKMALFDAMAERPDPRWSDAVLQLAEGAMGPVAERAASVMARLEDARFIPWLIGQLRYREGRAIVRDALVHQGSEGLSALVAALRDPNTDPKVRLHLPRTISRFLSQRAADILFDVVMGDGPGLLRYKALRGLGRMVASAALAVDRPRVEAEIRKNLVQALRAVSFEVALGTRDVQASTGGALVLGLLHDKRRQAMERAFRLLQIANRAEDIPGVFSALGSKDNRLRAQALEFLEALTAVSAAERRRTPDVGTTRDDVRELVRVLGDDLPDAERVNRGLRFLESPPKTPNDALTALMEDRDDTVATVAGYAALELGSELLVARVDAAMAKRPSLAIASSLEASRGPASRRPSVAHG